MHNHKNATPFETQIDLPNTKKGMSHQTVKQVLLPTACVKGTWGAELVEGLQESDFDLVMGRNSHPDVWMQVLNSSSSSSSFLSLLTCRHVTFTLTQTLTLSLSLSLSLFASLGTRLSRTSMATQNTTSIPTPSRTISATKWRPKTSRMFSASAPGATFASRIRLWTSRPWGSKLM